MRAALWLLLALIMQGPTPAAAGDAAENAGDVLRAALPAAAFALTFVREDRDGRRDFYRSFGATVAGTLALKAAVDRQRPDGSDDDAFPSGHAATAFQGAAFIHRRYGIRQAWPAYALAAFVAWSRVDADEHDAADVLGGAALGIAGGMLLTEPRPSGASIGLAFSGDGFRLSWSRAFGAR